MFFDVKELHGTQAFVHFTLTKNDRLHPSIILAKLKVDHPMLENNISCYSKSIPCTFNPHKKHEIQLSYDFPYKHI